MHKKHEMRQKKSTSSNSMKFHTSSLRGRDGKELGSQALFSVESNFFRFESENIDIIHVMKEQSFEKSRACFGLELLRWELALLQLENRRRRGVCGQRRIAEVSRALTGRLSNPFSRRSSSTRVEEGILIPAKLTSYIFLQCES